MAIKFISVKCPECGATLEIEEGRNKAFCSYCGAKILIYDENHHEYVYRTIDDAGLKQAEVRLKELEYEEKKTKAKIRWTIALIISNILLFALGYIWENVLNNKVNEIFAYFVLLFLIISFIAILTMWDNSNNKKEDK